MTKTFLFLPAYALLMIGFFVYLHHPPSSSCGTCKPSFCIKHILSVLSAPFPLVLLHQQNHPFTKYTVFHILSCFSHFWPAIIVELAKSLTNTRQKKPSAHPSYNKCNQILFYFVKVLLSRTDSYFIHIYCLPVHMYVTIFLFKCAIQQKQEHTLIIIMTFHPFIYFAYHSWFRQYNTHA